MRGRLVFAPEFPREVRNAVEPLVKRWLPKIAPRWLVRLTVRWHDAPAEPGASASMVAWDEYGNATMRVCPGWLDQDDAKREEDVVHELVHLLNEPMQDAVDKLLRHTVPEAQRDYARGQWVKAMEQSTVDTASALLRSARR